MAASITTIVYSIGGSHVGVVTFSPVHGEVLCEFKDRLYVNAVCMKTMVGCDFILVGCIMLLVRHSFVEM